MSDIIDRLNEVSLLADFEADAMVIKQAADEIYRLREAISRLAEQDATLSVKGGNVIVQMDATLTDAEREAVAWAVQLAKYSLGQAERYDALSGLLERTGDCPASDNAADRDSGTTGSE